MVAYNFCSSSPIRWSQPGQPGPEEFSRARQDLSEQAQQFVELCETYRGPKESISSAQTPLIDEDDELAGFHEAGVTEPSRFGSECLTPESIIAVRDLMRSSVREMNKATDSILTQLKARMTEQKSNK